MKKLDNKTEKKLKAFELIKEKRVNVNSIIYYLKKEVSDDQVRHWYNLYAIDIDEYDRQLNIEDVICLKEVLL